uniref:Uncharacterized protein n=1 Tax=Haemonchus contortus TaxID=6289 RepID=A0A7I4XYI0_HAECO
MQKIIHDFYSDLFDSHVYLPPHQLRQANISLIRIFRPKFDMPSRREVNMMNQPASELCRKKRATDLDSTKAGLACCQRYSTRFGKNDARNPLYTLVQEGIRSSELRHRTKIREAVDYARKSKIRWAGHVMRYSDDHLTRAVTDWIPRNIELQCGRQQNGRTSSRKL